MRFSHILNGWLQCSRDAEAETGVKRRPPKTSPTTAESFGQVSTTLTTPFPSLRSVPTYVQCGKCDRKSWVVP